MAVGNGELMHECFQKHSRMVRAQAEIYRGLDVGYVGVSLVLRNYVWWASW